MRPGRGEGSGREVRADREAGGRKAWAGCDGIATYRTGGKEERTEKGKKQGGATRRETNVKQTDGARMHGKLGQ